MNNRTGAGKQGTQRTISRAMGTGRLEDREIVHAGHNNAGTAAVQSHHSNGPTARQSQRNDSSTATAQIPTEGRNILVASAAMACQ